MSESVVPKTRYKRLTVCVEPFQGRFSRCREGHRPSRGLEAHKISRSRPIRGQSHVPIGCVIVSCVGLGNLGLARLFVMRFRDIP
jgi:hypothetical protein